MYPRGPHVGNREGRGRRELIRFKSDRLRVVTLLVQPVLFLFVLGTGLSSLASHGLPQGVDFRMPLFFMSGALYPLRGCPPG